MGKPINLLTPLTDAQVVDDTRLLPICDPVSGISGSATMAQIKKAVGTLRLKYVATGSEGTVVTIAALNQMNVLLISREGNIMDDVVSGPDDVEYIWDGTNITLGLGTRAGERFIILYDTK
jgi:hypothetical protein